jgi:hypothetical protein
MEKRTIVSGVILCAVIFALVVLSLLIPGLWVKYLSHWIILPIIALITTLLMGLVLMDSIFELDGKLLITLKRLNLKIEIGKHLVGAFLLVCGVAIILELLQFFLSRSNTSWLDPLMVITGAIAGIIIHIIGSKRLMKRVEFELERWEDNVL